MHSCFVLSLSGSLWFQTSFKIIYSRFVKYEMNILIGIVLKLYIALSSQFNIDCSNSWTWNVFTFICAIFNRFHQCFRIFRVQVFHLLAETYFIVFYSFNTLLIVEYFIYRHTALRLVCGFSIFILSLYNYNVRLYFLWPRTV